MKKLTSAQLRNLYLNYFKQNGHRIIPSASLIPENDATVLFTTAGMHPLVPYLLGEKHPEGKRLTNVQKCVRTGDIDAVGDISHCTFFEMLGNWSLGDYFKEEAIKYSFEFLTGKDYLDIPIEKIAVSVFAGDEDAPRDEVSANIWKSLGIKDENIFYLPKENNWWGPAGVTGPCGPDTEMFIDNGKEPCSENCSPACDCGKYLEIWNDVFMEYFKTAEGKFIPLKQKNVDTGMGLERTLCILNGLQSVYDTDIFDAAMAEIEASGGKKYGEDEATTKAFRIIADHMRTSAFMIGDQKGITPSNVDQGYVLRRLIRRAVRFGRQIGLKGGALSAVALRFAETYKDVYPEVYRNKEKIESEINKEEQRFLNTLKGGLKEFEKVITSLEGDTIDGKSAFRLYDTFGFPIEITCEMAAEKNLKVDIEGFKEAFERHQQISHSGSEQRFKGGLADTAEQTTKLHTATHLLLASLRKLLGDHIEQRGSNITAERLRFDFNFDRPLTEEEIKKIEDMVNAAIKQNLPVICEEMSVEEAKSKGAVGIFTSKYGEKVKVYSAGDFSKEICGGPHVDNTGKLGEFEIQKEQSSSAGVRRIRAILK
jgi:alanyl-tRNA synthetase